MEDRLILVTKDISLFMKLNTYCNDHGWMVYNTTDPNEVLDFTKHKHVAGIIWDLNISNKNETLKLIQKIRLNFDKPIITLTSKKELDYEMKLFALHIDDYIVEPYEYEEIIVRMQQLLWSRTLATAKAIPELVEHENLDFTNLESESKKETATHHITHHKHFKFDDLLIDIDHYRVLKDDVDLGLTPKEFKLLQFLIKHEGQVLSRDQLLQGVWHYDEVGTSRIVDIHVSHLRDKIEPNPDHPKYIKTVRGFGYVFEHK